MIFNAETCQMAETYFPNHEIREVCLKLFQQIQHFISVERESRNRGNMNQNALIKQINNE